MKLKHLFMIVAVLVSSTTFANTNEGENAYQAGINAYNRDEYQNAVYAFENSIAYDPTLYKSYCMLGLSYILNDEPEKGIETYQQAIKKFPDEWNAYILAAEFYETQGNNSEALSYYLQAHAWSIFATKAQAL